MFLGTFFGKCANDIPFSRGTNKNNETCQGTGFFYDISLGTCTVITYHKINIYNTSVIQCKLNMRNIFLYNHVVPLKIMQHDKAQGFL